MKEITFEEFVNKYKPIKSSLDEFAPYDGYLFEEYQEFAKRCSETSNRLIWTLVDCENEESWIIPGYHIVNKVGWFITNKKWINENIQVNLNTMISTTKAMYACGDFIEEKLGIPLEDFEAKLIDWWGDKF